MLRSPRRRARAGATRAGRHVRRRLRGGGPVVLGPGPARARWTPSSTRASSTCRCASSSASRWPPRPPPTSRGTRSTRLVDEAVSLARHHEPGRAVAGCRTPRCWRADLPHLDLADATGHDLAPEDEDRARPPRGGGRARGRSAHHELRGRRLLRPPRPLRLRDEPRLRGRVRDVVVLASRCRRWPPRAARCSATAGTTSTRKRARLDAPEEIGRIAAQRALRRLGARRVKTAEVPVVFDPEMAASLVRHIAGAVSGPSLYRGASFLVGKLGEHDRRARRSPSSTTAPFRAALGSRPFDGEGLPVRRTVVVDEGVLDSYLLDTYSGRKLGMPSTHHARARRQRGERVHDEPVPRRGPDRSRRPDPEREERALRHRADRLRRQRRHRRLLARRGGDVDRERRAGLSRWRRSRSRATCSRCGSAWRASATTWCSGTARPRRPC